MKNITGTLIWYYFICKREAWLMAHEISPFQDDDLLEIGRIISEESYRREIKEISIGNIKIDLMKRDKNSLLVCEIKKSSKFLKSAKMQLLFYLYKLKQKGISAKGELLIPKEKRRLSLELSEKYIEEIEKTIEDMKRIIKNDTPPPLQKTKFCNRCAYKEFCFA